MFLYVGVYGIVNSLNMSKSNMTSRLSGKKCKFFNISLSVNSHKRLNAKKTKTKATSLTRKPQCHVWVLIYPAWARVVFTWVLKVICIYFASVLLRLVIGSKNSCQFFSLSQVKPNPIAICSSKFSCTSCNCFKFWLNNGLLCVLCDWPEFTLVLVLWHSFENCSIPAVSLEQLWKTCTKHTSTDWRSHFLHVHMPLYISHVFIPVFSVLEISGCLVSWDNQNFVWATRF